MSSTRQQPGASAIVTYVPDPTNPLGYNPDTAQYLGSYGHVAGLGHAYGLGGGCDTLQCILQTAATDRPSALDPGRILQEIRGSDIVWDGILQEPDPSGGQGWAVTAQGSGHYGDNFDAVYTSTWPSGQPDQPVNLAIARADGGMRWTNPGIGSPAGLWKGSPFDSGSISITEMLNTATSMGGLTWYVDPAFGKNTLSVFSLPVTPTRLLVVDTPVARTVSGHYNRVWLRYQITEDGDTPATYGLAEVSNSASIAKYGPLEIYGDLSSAGVMTLGAAQEVGLLVMERYQAISYSSSFTIGPGQLMTLGGQPVDLGLEQAGEVYRPLLTDFSYGGEVSPLPVQFLGGGFSWDDDSQSATLTPFNYLALDFSSLLSQAATAITPVTS